MAEEGEEGPVGSEVEGPRAAAVSWKRVAETSPDQLILLDQEGRILWWNRPLPGGWKDDVVGKAFLEVARPEDRPAVEDCLERVAREGKAGVFESEAPDGRGGRRRLETRVAPLRGPRGVEGFVLSSSDVTRWLEGQEELRQSRSRYRSLVEDQTELVVRWKPDGTRLFTNGAYLRSFGLDPAAAVGSSFYDLVPERAKQGIEEKIRGLTPEAPVQVDVHQVLRPDGSTGWQEWTDRGFFDDEGRLTELQSVGRDVTERKLAEERLRNSEERYRFLSESISDVIFTWELGAGLTYVSPSVEPLLGLSPEEVRSMRLRDLVASPSPEVLAEVFRERLLVEEEENGTVDVELRRSGGETVWCEIRARVLRREDNMQEVILGVARDLSSWREKQEILQAQESRARQAQRLEALGQLAGGIAHDFNNLLTVVTGNAGMLRMKLGADHELHAYVEEIAKAASNASELTRQLLTFARKQPLAPRSVDLGSVVRDAQRILRRLIREDVELDLDLGQAVVWVEADPVQLEQVLFNLAVNAVDAMPREGGRIRIESRPIDVTPGRPAAGLLPGPWVRLSVVDSGIGIAPEIRDKIFEPFFTTKEGGRGTGLGLSTVYGIVQQAGGEIRVDSKAGAGSRFDVFLPRARPGRVPSVGVDPAGMLQASTETILLVEDESGVRRLAREVLVEEGYEVIEAGDGNEALALWATVKDRVDAVVTDVVMPGMSGVDLVERLGEDRPEIPVLYMSGHSDRILQTHGRHRSERSFLAKPFDPETLVARLRSLLED